jgi:signal-transduction protein with cAMP-binding, CBS, and nucleotidyltransferase domain
LRLEAQLAALSRGEEPDNRIRMDDLSWLEQRRLRDALQSVAVAQKAATLRFRPG